MIKLIGIVISLKCKKQYPKTIFRNVENNISADLIASNFGYKIKKSGPRNFLQCSCCQAEEIVFVYTNHQGISLEF